MVNIALIVLLPISRPKAIPGFSMNVKRKKLSIMLTLEPGRIPCKDIPRKGKFIPLTRNLLIWSIITTKKEKYKTLKIDYPLRFLHSIQCCVIGTNSSLSFGINGHVSHKYFGSSIQSMQSPYVPWSILVNAS